MDCLEGMKMLSDKSVDMIITDPPYGINLTPQRSGSKFKNTKVVNDSNLDWLPQIVMECFRLLKDNSVCYIFCNWQNYDVFKQEFQKLFTIKNCIVWDKDWFGMGNNWRPNHEFIMVVTNGKFKTISNNKSNILKQRRIPPQKLSHSCEKPVKLIEELIIETAQEKNITVLDPFIGSGSTAIACINTKRNFLGFELDETHYQVANTRIVQALMK